MLNSAALKITKSIAIVRTWPKTAQPKQYFVQVAAERIPPVATLEINVNRHLGPTVSGVTVIRPKHVKSRLLFAVKSVVLLIKNASALAIPWAVVLNPVQQPLQFVQDS